MSIRVLFFASFADIVGKREAVLSAPAFPDVGSVFAGFKTQFPRLAEYRTSVLCSVNSEFARPDTPIRDGDEIAFFPPVSGG